MVENNSVPNIAPAHGIETTKDASDLDNGPERSGESLDMRTRKFGPPQAQLDPKQAEAMLPGEKF